MDGAQVGIFEKSDQIGLRRFLQGHDGTALETKVGFEILGDFTDQTLEGKLSDQKLGRLLVASDFTKGNGSRSVSVRLLDTSGGRGRLASSLGGQLLAGSFASSGFAIYISFIFVLITIAVKRKGAWKAPCGI